jgi:hypothetical protein
VHYKQIQVKGARLTSTAAASEQISPPVHDVPNMEVVWEVKERVVRVVEPYGNAREQGLILFYGVIEGGYGGKAQAADKANSRRKMCRRSSGSDDESWT